MQSKLSIEILNQHLADKAIEIERLGEELAEMRKEFVEKDNKIQKQWLQIQADTEYIQRLEQQLAEKEKELKQLKLDLGMFKSVNEFINRYGIEKARNVLLQTEKTKLQDKLDFTIAELEKVKEYIGEKIYELDTTYPKFERYEEKAYNNIIKFMDNQLKALNEEKVVTKKE